MIPTRLIDKRFAFLGAGIIANVLIERILNAGVTPPENILATDINPLQLEAASKRFGIIVSEKNCEAATFGDFLVIAAPPNVVKSVLSEISSFTAPTLCVISLAAGISTQAVEDLLQTPLPLLRIAPNIPSLVGAGMNPHCLGKHVNAEDIILFDDFLRLLGETIRVEERMMNVMTALTAVGPTYIFPTIKCLTEAAVRKGLPMEASQFVIAQLVLGTARLVLDTKKDPDELKKMIGTRTINEGQLSEIIALAFESALEKVSAIERKLAA